ncbi:MAG: DedA family protein [Rhodocyclales bacterium]|nr:DedA family protein [Rhodocyclales bacterium]
MDFLFTAQAGLAGLFLASFLAATLLPGGSEAVLAALLLAHPEQAPAALLLATVGNTAGGMVTYGMGRLLPQRVMQSGIQPDSADGTAMTQLAAVRKHGAPALLLAWAPFVGDALCVAAGWLRLPWLACALWMALGKGGRYLVVAAGVGMF